MMNLRSNKDATIAAIVALDFGGDDERGIEEMMDERSNYKVPAALRWLDEVPEDGEFWGSFTVYGAGGWHRYAVLASGEVRFSKYHCPSEEKCALAQSMGFALC